MIDEPSVPLKVTYLDLQNRVTGEQVRCVRLSCQCGVGVMCEGHDADAMLACDSQLMNWCPRAERHHAITETIGTPIIDSPPAHLPPSPFSSLDGRCGGDQAR